MDGELQGKGSLDVANETNQHIFKCRNEFSPDCAWRQTMAHNGSLRFQNLGKVGCNEFVRLGSS